MGKQGKRRGGKGKQKVRVDFRRNRARPSRTKDWTRLHGADNEKTDALPMSESVVAKGDLSRKRTVIESEGASDKGAYTGVVIAMRGLIAEVDDGTRVWPCTVRRILRTLRIDERQAVTVGDRVRFSIEADEAGVVNEGVVEQVEPRHGELKRSAKNRVHTVVANVDQAIIVASAGMPSLKTHLIDRYIVAVHHGEITPVICINKADLDVDKEIPPALDLYRSLGYTAFAASIITGEGIDTLRDQLRGKCTAIAGQSGVGKSSLLNATDPNLNLRVGDINMETSKGRHTTTTAQLIKLAGGGYVVDTPGIRSFDLSAVPLNEVEAFFVEFVPHIPNCRFPDCSHTHECNCAVKAALAKGQITEQRYESYCRMLQERLA